MKIIRNPAEVTLIEDDFLRRLIERRFAARASDRPFEARLHGVAVVMAPQDPIGEVVAELDGLLAVECSGDGLAIDYVEQHHRWYEVALIPGRREVSVLVFVPRDPGVEAGVNALRAHRAMAEGGG